MSHMIKGTLKLDPRIAEQVCKKHNLKCGVGSISFYNDKAEGFWFELPGWRYPVVITKDGIFYDNYGGNWGDEKELINFYKEYTKEVLASANMYVVQENVNEDGTIEIIAEEY